MFHVGEFHKAFLLFAVGISTGKSNGHIRQGTDDGIHPDHVMEPLLLRDCKERDELFGNFFFHTVSNCLDIVFYFFKADRIFRRGFLHRLQFGKRNIRRVFVPFIPCFCF